ncbi:threonine-phosphate decarboxylase [Vibrio sp. LaRot3]|uniref:threonine-phosphate decarboxylase n=1 Tax=Vibrio sp. LaRot3 TaxID=2998829 RepID=UPI0022CDF176|nr:threonine-phosphate decarboxylase [Vibrio sp. LaRot3]MDA0149610.1 pyridoxal phosphate-dependent class II aminotransferase [Vibrio sp. LaRot3]
MLHHGGRLQQVAAQYNTQPSQWLDLSTGISPFSYQVGDVPQHVWHRLPEEEDGLLQAAQAYYGYQDLLPVAGSQAAIQLLPRVIEHKLGRKGTVLLPERGYQEHRQAWQKSYWHIEQYQTLPSQAQLQSCDAVLIINPNNPSTFLASPQQLDYVESHLPNHAVLVIDEAFMDEQDQSSRLISISRMQHDEVASSALPHNVIVLRSIGKFFGLAGSRVGFVAAHQNWLEQLRSELGPWTICGASRWVVTQALKDSQWQQQARSKIKYASELQLERIQSVFAGCIVSSAGLFIRLEHSKSPELYQALCQQSILVRLTDEQDALRFGLCADAEQLERLICALNTISIEYK